MKSSADAYVHQYVDNPYPIIDGTYVVMNSDYRLWNSTFSLTGTYAAVPFTLDSNGTIVDPSNRYIEVRTSTTDNKFRTAENCVDSNDVSVLTRLDNQTYGSKLRDAAVYGDCRTVDTIKYPNKAYRAYCEMNCTLRFN